MFSNSLLPGWTYSIYILLSFSILFLILTYCKLIQRQGLNFSLRHTSTQMNNLHGNGDPIEPPSQRGQSFGLTTAVIHSLPAIRLKETGKKVEAQSNVECVVCLADFSEGDWLRLLPNCAHVFHLSCIDTWLRSHSTCPICRTNIVPSDDLHVVPVDGLLETLPREEPYGERPTIQSGGMRNDVNESNSRELTHTDNIQ